MDKKNEIELQKQIELAAEALAKIFVEQVLSRKTDMGNKVIEKNYGKSNQ